MAEQSFWDMLRTKRDSLTKSGIIVADYLMQHAEDAQYLSISSLAKACGVAEATIFRFCRALGLDGKLGAIAPGYQADAVVLDRDLNIKHVVLRGKAIA